MKQVGPILVLTLAFGVCLGMLMQHDLKLERARAERAKLSRALKLERVVDGDTVYIRYFPKEPIQGKLRLLRINTPERGCKGYKEATNALKGLLEGKKLSVKYEVKGVQVTGGYGRLLVYLYAGKLNVNVEMVRLGWSMFYTKYGEGRLAEDFKRAEAEARKARRGLWK